MLRGYNFLLSRFLKIDSVLANSAVPVFFFFVFVCLFVCLFLFFFFFFVFVFFFFFLFCFFFGGGGSKLDAFNIFYEYHHRIEQFGPRPGIEVLKLSPFSTQLSTKFAVQTVSVFSKALAVDTGQQRALLLIVFQ